MLEAAAEHVRRVRSVVHGRLAAHHALAPGRDALLVPAAPPDDEPCLPGAMSRITRSWIRCLREYKLDPGACLEPEVVSPSDLRARRERQAELQAVAKVEMANLYQQLAGAGYAIILSDRDGVLLDYFGDPACTHAASKTGLMPGAVWSERVQGTNGMGTCLFEQRPVTVHQDEHYLSRNIRLSCVAAPLFDHDGALVGVLDASGESHLAQQHTLALVKMSVQMIENRVFAQQFRHEFIMRFHNRPEFIGTLSEGAIALSVTGKILAATRSAIFQLGRSSRTEIVGHDVTELFNITFCGLVDASTRKALQPVPVFEARSGARFFATMMQPPSHLQVASPAGLALPGNPARPPLRGDAPASGATALDALTWGDPQMTANIDTARRVNDRNVAILLQGETGSGKERFARAIHLSSRHGARAFVAINCASIPESLIESELFGYRSGAFTGASKDGQRGKLLQANGGTLFLDEIGDMPVALQARLLRVLEEREVTALGGESAVRLDIHLISATHCDLHEKIRRGEFRSDLYYRLQGVTITLPPLRERSDRRALIVQLAAEESDAGSPVELDASLLAMLEQQRWPGNLRQLRHLLRTMIALRQTDCLTLRDVPPDYHADRAAGARCAQATGTPDERSQASPGAGDAFVKATAPGDTAQAPARNRLASAERLVLLQELAQHDWNLSGVARALGISRNTLYRKLQRLDISARDKVLIH